MFMNCYADFNYETGNLCLGNDKIEKVIEVKGSCICTSKIIDKTKGKIWGQDLHKWQRCPVLSSDEEPKIKVESTFIDSHPLMKPHLRTALKLEGEKGTVKYVYIIFPEIPFVYTQAFVENYGAVISEKESTVTLNITGNENLKIDAAKQSSFCSADTLDCIPLGSSHLEVESFLLFDKTDINDSLVERQTVPVYKRGRTEREGNIFRITDFAEGDSLMLIKHSPTPSSALQRKSKDLVILGNSHALLMGTGVDFSDLPGEEIPYYASAVGVAKTEDIMEAFWQYSTAFSSGDVGKKLFIMSNTWGDRSQDMAVCEEFILKELERGHYLGLDILQIDDGWESGITVNSLRGGSGVWEGYYGTDSDFWAVNPERFPHGLEPVVEKAASFGIELGLWFSPDSSDEFANYKKDIETIWGLYLKYGVKHYKLDGIKIRSKVGEKRFLNFLEELTMRSGGEIRFNLDVTAEDRFGYMYAPQYGSLFVENRYTDWGNYYPHNTFKNLWNLSSVIPTRRLQMELLNKNRNPHQYEGMAFAPALYSMDYLFATVMPANPLLWMEVSHLPTEDALCLAGITKEYKKYQAELFAACVMPIGDVPNGRHFSGYCCKNSNGNSGHLILFREESFEDEFTFNLPVSLENTEISVIYKNSPAELACEANSIRVKIHRQRGFIWLRYSF